MIKEIIDFISVLEKRKEFFIRGSSYSDIVNFLTGYSLGLSKSLGYHLIKDEFSDWFKEKYNTTFNMPITDYLYNFQNKEKDEKKACEILFQLLTEFLNDKLKALL